MPSSWDRYQTPTVLLQSGCRLHATDSAELSQVPLGSQMLPWVLTGTSESHILVFNLHVHIFWSELNAKNSLLLYLKYVIPSMASSREQLQISSNWLCQAGPGGAFNSAFTVSEFLYSHHQDSDNKNINVTIKALSMGSQKSPLCLTQESNHNKHIYCRIILAINITWDLTAVTIIRIPYALAHLILQIIIFLPTL